MRKWNRNAVIALAAALVTASASATEMRNHYLVARHDRQAAFEVTRIHEAGPTLTSTTFLIADKAGPLMIAAFSTDYSSHLDTTTYTLLRGTKATATIVQQLPFSGGTQAEAERELRENGRQLQGIPIDVVITGPQKQQIRARETDWTKVSSQEQRAKVRTAFGGDLAAALENIAELAGLPPFAELNSVARYFLEPEKLVRRSIKLMVATGVQNCAFDTQFGRPCAAK